MGTLEVFFLWVVQSSLTASIVALLVILILKLFNNFISVRIKHALWILVLIRLFIPIAPESHISLFNLLSEKYKMSSPIYSKDAIKISHLGYDFLESKNSYLNGNEKDDYYKNDINNFKNKTGGNKEITKKENKNLNTSLSSIILKTASCVWGTGAIILTLVFLFSSIMFKVKSKNFELVSDSKILLFIEKYKKRLSISSNVCVYICDTFKSPCILGIIKPKIYIPKCMYNTEDFTQLEHVLLHELVHYKRKDLVFNLLSTIAILVHWFNPIIWFSVKKMKFNRECACDTYALEILGEEQAIEYGMTLINSSRMFLNNNKPSQLAIFFETKNQIERRIKMIKNFKKGSYKMSTAAIVSCLIISGITLTNGVTVKGIENNKAVATATNNEKNENQFLIDAPLKSYDKIKKAQDIVGFKVKVPDYIPSECKVYPSFQVIKNSKGDKYLGMSVDNSNRKSIKGNFGFDIYEKDCIETLKNIPQENTKEMSGAKVEKEEQAMKIGNINGSNVTIKTMVPARKTMDFELPSYEMTSKYFVWKDSNLWYSIKYYEVCNTNNTKKNKPFLNLPQNEIEKVSSSIKYLEDVKNVNYSEAKEVSTELGTLNIYDKEDLNEAKKLLGFNPKLSLNIDKDIRIDNSSVGISGESDIENKDIKYELDNFYFYKKGRITFTQAKVSKNYDDLKKNGYLTHKMDGKEQQIKVDTLNINNTEVLKYEENGSKNENKFMTYLWKDKDIYYSILFVDETENTDEIVKKFIISQPIN